MLRPLTWCAAVVLALAGLAGCGDDGGQWSESKLAKAMLKEAEGDEGPSVSRMFVRANLNDLHGEDGAVARAMELPDHEKIESRVRQILAVGGRKDLARSTELCVALVADRTRVLLPTSKHRRPVPANPVIVSVGHDELVRVSTGTEMSLPVSTIDEVLTFASTVVAHDRNLARIVPVPTPTPTDGGGGYQVKQVKFKSAKSGALRGLEEDRWRSLSGAVALEDWTVEVGSTDDWAFGDAEIPRSALAERIRQRAPEGVEAVVLRLTSDALLSDLMDALEEVARAGTVKLVGLTDDTGGPVVWAEIGAEGRPLAPRTVALKADRRVKAATILEVLDALRESTINSVTILSRLDIEDRTADRETFPGALPGGIELLLKLMRSSEQEP